MIKCIIFLLLTVNIYAQDLSTDVSDNIQPLLVEELSELELMLIANINTNETLQNFFKLDIINKSIRLNAPKYNRFAAKNNTGMFLPVNTSTSLYLDAGLPGLHAGWLAGCLLDPGPCPGEGKIGIRGPSK